jgi:transposase
MDWTSESEVLMGHVTGQSRDQMALFAESLGDLVPADHVVRVIDAFVDGLDLAGLKFSKVEAEATGRPPYHPGDLLKLYLYGYLNQVRSSRRLAREAGRNIEVMWLSGRVRPSFKTIADFRKDHGPSIIGVARAFTAFCRGAGLFGAELLAVDGTKVWAVASKKQVMTPKRIAKMTAAIDAKVAGYLAAMDEADTAERSDEPAPADVKAALAALGVQRDKLQRLAASLEEEGAAQRVMTEPDARLMRTARHGFQVAYNAQTAVDSKHKLIAAFDLVNDGNDFHQLHPMAAAGKDAVGAAEIDVVADAGYSNGAQGTLCEADGITAMAPRPKTVNPEGGQYFSRERFAYDAASDTWLCPAGAALVRRKTSQTEAKAEYGTAACGGCALKAQCTGAARRVVVRSFHEDAREAMHQRAAGDPKWMKLRRAIVEHPFAGVKWLMGYPRFLLSGLKKAKSELAMSVTAYNMKRAIATLGVPAMLKALRPVPA